MGRAKQITVRNVPAELARRLKALAEARGESVNGTVLQILEDAVGTDSRLEHLRERYATWTAEDEAEFADALRAQRVVDDELWK